MPEIQPNQSNQSNFKNPIRPEQDKSSKKPSVRAKLLKKSNKPNMNTGLASNRPVGEKSEFQRFKDECESLSLKEFADQLESLYKKITDNSS